MTENFSTYPKTKFGDTPELQDRLAELISNSKKTATSSALQSYKDHNEDIPKAGDQVLVLDSKDIPTCLIEIQAVDIVAFNDVTEEMAGSEGEGGLEYWRKEHERFFTEQGYFSTDMQVVFERFKVIK